MAESIPPLTQKPPCQSVSQTMRSILQDAMIRIPYLHSTDPTNILAIYIDSQSFGPIYSLERIYKVIKWQKKSIVSHQIKMHYHGITAIKIMVIEFSQTSKAKQFKQRYGKTIDFNFQIQQKNEKQANESYSKINAMSKFTKSKSDMQKITVVDKKDSEKNKPEMVQQKDENQHIKQDLYGQFMISFCKTVDKINSLQGILFTYGLISVQYPQSQYLRSIVKNVAKLVVVEGIRAEEQLHRIYEDQNIKGLQLSFLNNKNVSSEHIYYRWRVYSYLQGDGDQHYRTEPYQMVRDGPLWYPPEQRIIQKYGNYMRVLLWQQRVYLTQKLLDGLSSNKKYLIEQAMAFCIFNINCAVQICVILTQKFIQHCTKISQDAQFEGQDKKIIGVMQLISDILFNSPTFIYRELFLTILPDMLYSYILNAYPSQIQLPAKIANSVNLITKKMIDIVSLWNKKFIFEEEFCKGLELMLMNAKSIVSNYGECGLLKNNHQKTVYKELLSRNTGMDEEYTDNQQKEGESKNIVEILEKYGVPHKNMQRDVAIQILAILKSNQKLQQMTQAMQPQLSVTYDGQQLTEKDLQKIKTKNCKVISCENVPVRNLFTSNPNIKNSTGSIDKE